MFGVDIPVNSGTLNAVKAPLRAAGERMNNGVKPHYVTKTAFARMAGVSGPAISKQLRTGALKESLFGEQIDINHPSAINYLRGKNKRPAPPGSDTLVVDIDQTNNEGGFDLPEGSLHGWASGMKPDEIEQCLNMTLRQIFMKFGTDDRFLNFLKAVKQIEDIKEKQLKNEATKGDTVNREFVRTHIFGMIESIFSRIVNDSPPTIVSQVVQSREAGQSNEELTELVTKLLSAQVVAIKQKATTALKKGRGK
jgi:hypothetical protein